MKNLNYTTHRIAWRYGAHKMTATELEQLIDRLIVDEQAGEVASQDIYHLEIYLQAKGKNYVR